MLVDRDQAEAARGERVTEDCIDSRGHSRRATRGLGQHQVADLGIIQIRDHELAPLALVDRGEVVAATFRTDDTEQQFSRLGEQFHRVRDEAVPRLLGPRQDAVVERQRRAPSLFKHTQPRRRGFSMPLLGYREHLPVLDRHHPQHRHARHPARLLESPSRRRVDQPFVGHVLEQRFEQDLLVRRQPERPRNLALAGGLARLLDEFEDLLL